MTPKASPKESANLLQFLDFIPSSFLAREIERKELA
jgi:hypothetical protein